MIPTLFAYQLDLVRRVREARLKGHRIIVVQSPTGTGKTTVAAYIVKNAVAKGSRILIIVHRRKIVEQISERLVDFEIDHGIIMAGEMKDTGAAVQVASRDTLMSRCVRNQWLGMPAADLIIIDEAHRAADSDSDYRHILANYPNATILLLTATPVGPDSRGLGPWAQAIECAAPTSQLVRDGYLLPVKCFAPDRKTTRAGKAKRGIAGDLVESWKKYAENLPTVLFCSRVQHSIDAVAAYNAAGIPAAHVDADTPDEKRDEIFAQLGTGDIKVVSNVGIIKEGVDIPCLGCCQFYMDVSGRVMWLQAIGRIMRIFEGQKYGIVIDHAGAVFRHGFPDEDMTWTLEGNADDDFVKKKKNGDTEPAMYCKKCELIYHGSLLCPQCGRAPSKPPRSIFAPPEVDTSNELLTEADRNEGRGEFSKEVKMKHWLTCLRVAFHKDGTFGKAAMIFKSKYNEFPQDGFPCMPGRHQWKLKVSDLFPNYGRKKAQ